MKTTPKAKTKAKPAKPDNGLLPNKDPVTGQFLAGNTAWEKARRQAEEWKMNNRQELRKTISKILGPIMYRMFEIAMQPSYKGQFGQDVFAPNVFEACKYLYEIAHGKPGIRKEDDEQNLEITVDREEVLAKLKTLLEK